MVKTCGRLSHAPQSANGKAAEVDHDLRSRHHAYPARDVRKLKLGPARSKHIGETTTTNCMGLSIFAFE
jgi:hypothetical protein